MLQINVSIQSLTIENYSREGLVLNVKFKDDKEKLLKHDVDLSNLEEAEIILKKIREYERRENQGLPEEDDILSGTVNVIISNEEETIKKMNEFIRKLAANLKNVTSSRAATNYIQTISNMKNLRLDL